MYASIGYSKQYIIVVESKRKYEEKRIYLNRVISSNNNTSNSRISSHTIILDVVNDARKSEGLSEAKMIYSGINNYCMEAKLKKQLNGSENICEDGVTTEEVSQMVNLGSSKVTNVKYENGTVTELTVESNNKIIELQPNGSFTINGETSGTVPENPGVQKRNCTMDKELIQGVTFIDG